MKKKQIMNINVFLFLILKTECFLDIWKKYVENIQNNLKKTSFHDFNTRQNHDYSNYDINQ